MNFHIKPRLYRLEGVLTKFVGTESDRLPNPGQLELLTKSRTWARIFVGLTRGHHSERFGFVGDEVDEQEVIDFVSAVRSYQLGGKGLLGGADFISQRGYFTKRPEGEGDPVYHGQENSLQVVVWPGFDVDEHMVSFPKHMKTLTAAIAQVFDQVSVIVDIDVEGKTAFIGAFMPGDTIAPKSEGESDAEYADRLEITEASDHLVELWQSGELETPEPGKD